MSIEAGEVRFSTVKLRRLLREQTKSHLGVLSKAISLCKYLRGRGLTRKRPRRLRSKSHRQKSPRSLKSPNESRKSYGS